MNIIKEACIETLEQAINAEKKGANRLEVCSRLDLDGMTPDFRLVKKILNSVTIPVNVMIRNRAGNFVYSSTEVEEMIASIKLFKTTKINGFVFGALNNKNQIDIETTRKIAGTSYPMKVTFHKAIDDTTDIIDSIKKLMEIKEVTHVLTSGGCPTALEGRKTLKKMIAIVCSRPEVIVAGKVTNENLGELNAMIGASEYHGRKIVGNLG